MSMKKSRLLWLSLVVWVGVGLAIGSLKTTALAQTKLTLWYPAGQITAGVAPFADQTLFSEFEAKNNCKVVAIEGSYDTLMQKIMTSMVGGDVPEILFVDRSWVPGFLKEEVFERVPDADAKAWLNQVSPEIVELSDYGQGKMYGYPQYGVQVYGITWNKAHFKEAGLDPEKPPKTWEELRQYSLKLRKVDAFREYSSSRISDSPCRPSPWRGP